MRSRPLPGHLISQSVQYHVYNMGEKVFSSPSGASHFSIPTRPDTGRRFSSRSRPLPGHLISQFRKVSPSCSTQNSSRPLPGHLISQFLSLTPHILSGLAGYFAWENQIEAIFHSQTASKSLQTQYLSHARENTPYRRFSPQFTNIFYNNRISACTDAF